jgi:hypothetical protein
MKLLKISNIEEFIILDDEDFEKISLHKWYINSAGVVGRQIPHKFKRNPINISIANEVMNRYNCMFDHKDRDRKNNQKSNLREASISENMINRVKWKINASSPYKGVYWNKQTRKWISRLAVKGRRICLGYFASEIEAAKAYDLCAVTHFGEFAVLNFPTTSGKLE